MSDNTHYIVSARKYRPDSFEDLIGQDNIVRTLKNSIIRGKLAHAYLFCGPRGVGKTSAARIFAKTINCASPSEDMDPCGQCESCVSFHEGRSFCIHELDAASNNGVDDIKLLMDQVQIPPQVGQYSVYIIDEVHMLTQSAFNAFLKTLEEPPAHAIFILATTEKHKILPTILSRCQTYDFNRISIPDIVKNLREISQKEGITIDDESLHVIAGKADGAMRDALTIFDQTVAFCGNDVKYSDVIRNLNVLDHEHCFKLVESMLANDYSSALLEFDNVLSKGFNPLYFVASLSTHFRNLAVAYSGSLDALLELPDSVKKRYAEQASKTSLQFIYDALAVTVQCESSYKESINPRLHIEFALMKLCFLTGGEVSLSAARQAARPASQQASRPAADQNVKPAPNPSAPRQAMSSSETAPVVNIETGTNASAQQSESSQSAARTEASPQQRRRSAKTSSLSLGAIKQTGDISTQSIDPVSDTGKIPENEEIINAWKTFPQSYASRPRLQSCLSSALIEITESKEGKQLDFYVDNEVQRKWLEDMILGELRLKLQSSLHTDKVLLGIKVRPQDDAPRQSKPYTNEEKANALIGANDELSSLVKDFGLEAK